MPKTAKKASSKSSETSEFLLNFQKKDLREWKKDLKSIIDGTADLEEVMEKEWYENKIKSEEDRVKELNRIIQHVKSNVFKIEDYRFLSNMFEETIFMRTATKKERADNKKDLDFLHDLMKKYRLPNGVYILPF